MADKDDSNLSGEGAVPRFVVDLDCSPEHRWDGVMKHFREELQFTVTDLEEQLLPQHKLVKIVYKFVTLAAICFVYPWRILAIGIALALCGVFPVFTLLVSAALAFAAFCIPHRREIAGVARESNISCGKILLIQYVYEFVSACTSVIVHDATTQEPVRAFITFPLIMTSVCG